MLFVIEEELKKLPKLPGVYMMFNSKDEIIYIGKAISLKNRVRQYFQSSTNKSDKIKQMISKISRFEYIITDSELEALILENNLIKEHRPRYNTMLRDDKTYPYIKVSIKEDFPRIFLSRQIKKDRAKYYGPFSSSKAVNDTINLICKIFKLRNCNRNLPKDIKKQRPCLEYYINQCQAPCYGYIEKQEYQKQVKKAIDFLNGNFDEIIEEIKNKMMDYSIKQEYEEAARQRDLLNSVLHVTQKQKISSDNLDDKDIIALAKTDNDILIQVFFVRQGKMVGREHHYIQTIQTDESEILEAFVKQFYAGTPFLPNKIYLQNEISDEALVSRWLSDKKGSKVSLIVPKKGEKEKLIELAKKNAKLILMKDKEKFKSDEIKSIKVINELEKMLGIKNIDRIEAYDISNISGQMSVGSMVVYENGRPKHSDYRKFRIKSIEGPNDYASLEEVLTRRFLRAKDEDEKFFKLPKLILMDGGKGQVNVCLEVLKKFDLDIAVCGMVKDDRHRTRGLYYNNIELDLDTHSEIFRLITRIQDEAHRFAIEYHRSIRTKTMVKSSLDDIEGIGAVRRNELIKHFKEIEKIRNASIDELMELKSMNLFSATKVYDYFHKN